MQLKRTTYGIAKALIVALNVLLSALTILAAYGGMFDTARMQIPAIIAMTFPAFLILQVVSLAINILWFKRMALVNVATLAICWPSIATYCPIRLSDNRSADADAPTFSLMTYNVLNLNEYRTPATDFGYNRTLNYILKADPDIVALQECADISAGASITKSQVDSICKRYPYRSMGENGQSLLSKYPFKKLPIDIDDNSSFNVKAYQLTIDTLEVTLLNVHLQSIGLTDSDKELYRQLTKGKTRRDELDEIKTGLLDKLSAAFIARAGQAAIVRNALDSIKGPVILCGDFNDIPGCYAQRTIMGDDMHDAFREAGKGPAITYHANRLYFRIDHILYRGPLEPLKVSRPKFPSSDHYPLIATFAIE